jgi:hypothetical protein
METCVLPSCHSNLNCEPLCKGLNVKHKRHHVRCVHRAIYISIDPSSAIYAFYITGGEIPIKTKAAVESGGVSKHYICKEHYDLGNACVSSLGVLDQGSSRNQTESFVTLSRLTMGSFHVRHLITNQVDFMKRLISYFEATLRSRHSNNKEHASLVDAAGAFLNHILRDKDFSKSFAQAGTSTLSSLLPLIHTSPVIITTPIHPEIQYYSLITLFIISR